MDRSEVIIKAHWENQSKYLDGYKLTEPSNEIKEFVKGLTFTNKESDRMKLRTVIEQLQQKVVKTEDVFIGRTAEDIFNSGKRFGSIESSTLFCTVARELGFPTIQLLTINENYEKEGIKQYFFNACFIKDRLGKKEWVILDSSREYKSAEEIQIIPMEIESNDIYEKYKIYAYTNDYSELETFGIKIDSIDNLNKIIKISNF